MKPFNFFQSLLSELYIGTKMTSQKTQIENSVQHTVFR